MFVDFLFRLRDRGLPVGTTEFLSLLEALQRGLVAESLDRFYIIARAILVKRPEHFDLYDEVFAEYFRDEALELPEVAEIDDEFWEWLERDGALRELDEAERRMLSSMEALELDELREQFAERLEEQDERHDGGSHWVGTGGTSPFGHSGTNPAGVRVGGEGRLGRAVQVAQQRRFRNLRADRQLDVRQISVALRALRRLGREGGREELDVEATIDATARNAGDLEIVLRPPRENQVRLLLLMDVGGSMTPYTRLCEKLFSAAHQASHFKSFESYYFHNCIYERLFTDMARRETKPTREVLRNLDRGWRAVIVGDAAMAPSELTHAGGSIDYFHINEHSGLHWLQRIDETIPRTVWLNPDPPRYWTSWTTGRIRQIFPMFPLTLEGLDDAVERLRARRV